MIDRRQFLAAGVAAAAAPPSISQEVPSPTTSTRESAASPPAVTRTLVNFARGLRFEDLPAPVGHAAKRYLLDALGCGVAGHQSDKGSIAAATMASLRGLPEARILGTGIRVAVTNAAFANGELINALDYDAIPHIPPFTVPPILALAEATGASGKALIVAVVAAHEIAARLSAAAGQTGPNAKEGELHPVWGINNESVMAAAAGLANLLSLDETQALCAFGLAGYYCPPRVSDDWQIRTPLTMVKYTPAGWVCQASVTAVLMARAGFTAPGEVLDGPTAFPYYFGWEGWRAQTATAELGRRWRIQSVDFKQYACCRYLHSQVDCLARLLARHRLAPQSIDRIESLGVPLPANPDKMNVRTQVDAQFSTPYMLAVAASGIDLDAGCQSPERLKDPAIRHLMQKILWGAHPEAESSRREHPNSYIARVEVTAGGKRFVEEALYASGTSSAGLALTDSALEEKFLGNVSRVLITARATAARDMLWHLEDLDSASELMDALGP